MNYNQTVCLWYEISKVSELTKFQIFKRTSYYFRSGHLKHFEKISENQRLSKRYFSYFFSINLHWRLFEFRRRATHLSIAVDLTKRLMRSSSLEHEPSREPNCSLWFFSNRNIKHTLEGTSSTLKWLTDFNENVNFSHSFKFLRSF